jgi:hypothetical protein
MTAGCAGSIDRVLSWITEQLAIAIFIQAMALAERPSG